MWSGEKRYQCVSSRGEWLYVCVCAEKYVCDMSAVTGCVCKTAAVCVCPQGSQLGSGMQWMWQCGYSGCFLVVCVCICVWSTEHRGFSYFKGTPDSWHERLCVCVRIVSVCWVRVKGTESPKTWTEATVHWKNKVNEKIFLSFYPELLWKPIFTKKIIIYIIFFIRCFSPNQDKLWSVFNLSNTFK